MFSFRELYLITFHWIWHAIFEFNMFFYLNSPSWIFGEEGLPKEDICSKLTGMRSQTFITDSGDVSQSCIERIDSCVSGRSTVVVSIAITYFITNILPMWYNMAVKWYGRAKRQKTAVKVVEARDTNIQLVVLAKSIISLLNVKSLNNNNKVSAIKDLVINLDPIVIKKLGVKLPETQNNNQLLLTEADAEEAVEEEVES